MSPIITIAIFETVQVQAQVVACVGSNSRQAVMATQRCPLHLSGLKFFIPQGYQNQVTSTKPIEIGSLDSWAVDRSFLGFGEAHMSELCSTSVSISLLKLSKLQKPNLLEFGV